MVDTAIQGIALIVLGVALSAGLTTAAGFLAGVLGGRGALLTSVTIGVFALGLFAVSNGYFMLFEIIWSGQTPGKRLVGVRVIRENGYPIRPIDAVIRNVVRIVDWLPLLYGVGVLTMLLNTRAKRLGDYASGTLVVREGTRGGLGGLVPRSVPAGQPRAGLGGSAAATPSAARVVLSAADATLVRDFLVRRAAMHAEARAGLASRLAAALARRYALPLDAQASADPERVLEMLSEG